MVIKAGFPSVKVASNCKVGKLNFTPYDAEEKIINSFHFIYLLVSRLDNMHNMFYDCCKLHNCNAYWLKDT